MESNVLDTNALLSQYQQKWESRSSIRTRPRKAIDFSLSGYFYPIDKQVYSRGAHIDNDAMAVYRRMVMVYDILDIIPWHFFLQQPQQ